MRRWRDRDSSGAYLWGQFSALVLLLAVGVVFVPSLRGLAWPWWVVVAIVLASLAADIDARTGPGVRVARVPMNPYRYQHERIGGAVGTLMSLTMTSERRMQGAMGEVLEAFQQSDVGAGPHSCYVKILDIAGDVRDERWTTRLTPEERDRFSTAVWDLDRAISRAYYRVEAGTS